MTPDHRSVTVGVRFADADGRPLADADVTVEQTRHAFGFGNIGFDLLGRGGDLAPAERDPALETAWFELFDTATLPFYWREVEPVRGDVRTDRLHATAAWLHSRGVAVKGHPLVWHTLAPQWLLPLEDREVENAIRSRIRRDVTAMRGVVDVWDAINEAVILPDFTAEENAVTRLARTKGRVGMVAMAFEEAREADPSARLVLNDFDLGPAYERLVEDCLDAGIRIDALGLQTHMHQGYRGEEAVTAILDRFARFGLPLQLTETSLVSGELMPPDIVDLNDHVVDHWPSTAEGEARQADEIVRHYRSVFAHPAVESLTYWGITDAGAWLGAPIGLLRSDGSRKPAFDALRGLIKGEWWFPPTPARTDADGIVVVTGVAGRYRLTVSDGRTAEVDLSPAESRMTATLAPQTVP